MDRILKLKNRKLVYSRAEGAEGTARGIIKPLEGYRPKTLTYDNSPEFGRPAEVSKELKARGYFYFPFTHSKKPGATELSVMDSSSARVLQKSIILQITTRTSQATKIAA